MATQFRTAILVSAALIPMLAAVVARAADGPTQPDPDPAQLAVSPQPSDTSSQLQLQEVVVTAQRRAQNIQNVPISMTALTQTALNNQHIQNLSDLQSITPGLVFTTPTQSNPNGQSDIAIRGIFSGGASLAPTTQVYIDNTPIEEDIVGVAGVFSNPNPEIFDLDRVEVLRGPQGTLFGASAMGGAVRFITPQPSLTHTSGYAQGEMAYSPDGAPSYNLGIAYGAPVVSGVAGFRISAYYNYVGGYINQENPFTGQLLGTNINHQTSYSLRPALTIAPLTGLTVTLSEFLQNIDLANPPVYWLTDLPVPNPGGQEAMGWLQSQPTTDYLSIPALTIKYELPVMTVESNTSYIYRKLFLNQNQTNADQFFLTGQDFLPGVPPSDSWFWQNFEWTNAFQEELRFSSAEKPGQRLHWVVGLFYSNAKDFSSQVLPGSLDPITEACCGQTETQFFGGFGNYLDPYGQEDNGITYFRNTQNEKAVYGQISYDLTSRLNVAAGVRVSHDIVTAHQFIAGALNAQSSVGTNVTLAPQTENPVTPRASVSYHVAANTMLYATVAKGYRLGGSQIINFINSPACQPSLQLLPGVHPSATYRSDSLWSYELGAKSTVFNRLRVDASAYYINWSNIQTGIPLASCLEQFVANFGKAISKGGDIELNAALSDHLTLGVSGGYTDAYYGKTEIIGQALLAQEGERVPHVPPWSVAANVDYRRALPFWSQTTGYVRVDFRHISAMPLLDPAVAAYDPVLGLHQDPAYSMLNLRMGVVYGGLDASVFIDNATNSNPLVGYSHYGVGDRLIQATHIPPLTTGITVRYLF